MVDVTMSPMWHFVRVCPPGNQVSHLHINGPRESGRFLFKCECLNVYGVLFWEWATTTIKQSNHRQKQNHHHKTSMKVPCMCVCVCFTSRDICMMFEMSVEIMKPGSMLLSQYRLPESGTYLHSRSLFLCFSFFLFVSWGAACLSYLNIIQATPSCSDNNFLTKDEITASSKLKLQARKQAIWWMLHASFFTIFLCCCNCMSMAE